MRPAFLVGPRRTGHKREPTCPAWRRENCRHCGTALRGGGSSGAESGVFVFSLLNGTARTGDPPEPRENRGFPRGAGGESARSPTPFGRDMAASDTLRSPGPSQGLQRQRSPISRPSPPEQPADEPRHDAGDDREMEDRGGHQKCAGGKGESQEGLQRRVDHDADGEGQTDRLRGHWAEIVQHAPNRSAGTPDASSLGSTYHCSTSSSIVHYRFILAVRPFPPIRSSEATSSMGSFARLRCKMAKVTASWARLASRGSVTPRKRRIKAAVDYGRKKPWQTPRY